MKIDDLDSEMFKKRQRHLESASLWLWLKLALTYLLISLGLTSCILPLEEHFYTLNIPTFDLKEQEMLTKVFNLPAKKRTQSIALHIYYKNTLNDDVGRFKVNDQQFIDFKLLQNDDSSEDVLSSIRFLLPSNWFEDESNSIYFEHLSGDGATIEIIALDFDEAGQSPYTPKSPTKHLSRF